MALKVDAPRRAPKKVSVERSPQGFITGMGVDEDGHASVEPWTVSGVLPIRNVGAVQSVPMRTVRLESKLDGDPQGAQLFQRPAGWSGRDILDELNRLATVPGDDGSVWGIPGAKRIVLKVVSDTPTRIEVNALGFSDDEMYGLHEANEDALRVRGDRRSERIADLERQIDAKQAETLRFIEEFSKPRTVSGASAEDVCGRVVEESTRGMRLISELWQLRYELLATRVGAAW